MLKKQKEEELFKLLLDRGIARHFLEEPVEELGSYELYFKARPFYFKFFPHSNPFGINYRVESIPRTELTQAIGLNWQGAKNHFIEWADDLCTEFQALDLWVTTAEPTDDKFTRTELAEVQGQLRLLQQSFAIFTLPEAAKQKLIELTVNLSVAAETETKRDWLGVLVGGFTGAVFSLALNPTQAQELIRLVKAAFSGLFLQ